MTNDKFKSECDSLKNFFTIYCKNKHIDQKKYTKEISYKDISYTLQYDLCEDCHMLLDYCLNRLLECPHEVKPRCRKCPAPCYEKDKWKRVAKLMRYSGIKLGLINLKKYFI
ncbi:MAG: nitrous oxide-stimulated promoter family protein [Sphaerochaetaceae bacterium]|nr:nitrous oxide-stimulated promoter family protein [Sphaerochaetaceae bacterium]